MIKFLTFLICTVPIFCSSIDFTLKTVYLKPNNENIFKINIFTKKLEDRLDNFDWEFPHEDFGKIEINISVNIDKNISGNSYSGVITVSGGLVSDSKPPIPLKKDIYYSEQNINFILDHEKEPLLEDLDPSSIESIVLFYSYRCLVDVFDKLSYTDQKNFNLGGDEYVDDLSRFENSISSALQRSDWDKRIKMLNSIRKGKLNGIRKLNALLYNAVYFYNNAKKERAKYFIPHIIKILKETEQLPQFFYTNNYYALGEIFSLDGDPSNLRFLISQDPSHENYYERKLPAEQEAVKEEEEEIKNEEPEDSPVRNKRPLR